MRKPYPSDLTDEQWAIIEPLIPIHTVGRPRTNDMREVLNALFYLNCSGCPWDLLPHDLPATSTVDNHFAPGGTTAPGSGSGTSCGRKSGWPTAASHR